MYLCNVIVILLRTMKYSCSLQYTIGADLMSTYIDTHVHLNADQYDEDLQEVIQRALDANVEKMVVVGFDRKTIKRALKLANEYEFIYAVIGWHPVDAIDCTDEDLIWIEELAA